MRDGDGAHSSWRGAAAGVLLWAVHVGAGNQALRSLLGQNPWN